MIRAILKNKIFLKVLNKINFFIKDLKNVEIKEVNVDGNILILAPHADDESIGCAGIMLNYFNKVNVICITDGRYGDPEIEPNKMIEIRQNEFKNAMNFLKVSSYVFLSIEDSKVSENYKKFTEIDFNKYKAIFIPNYLDRHLDHKAVSNHIYKLIKQNYISKNTDIYYYEVWNTVPVVNSYIDISKKVNDKKNIINFYKSQIKHINYTDKIIALNKFRGLSLELDYAECYMKLSATEFINFMDSK